MPGKPAKLIRCLYCQKPLRWGNLQESPDTDREATHWFCSREHLYLYCLLHGDKVVDKTRDNLGDVFAHMDKRPTHFQGRLVV